MLMLGGLGVLEQNLSTALDSFWTTAAPDAYGFNYVNANASNQPISTTGGSFELSLFAGNRHTYLLYYFTEKRLFIGHRVGTSSVGWMEVTLTAV